MMKKFWAVIISMVAILILATAVSADPAAAILGGDFLLKYSTGNGKLTDKTGDPLWWEFQVITYKNFSDNGQAYLQLKATPQAQPFLAGFGYTYKVNDKLSFTWRSDNNGEFLTDGQVIGNGCDWHHLSKNVNFFNRVFIEKAEVKMDTSLIPGLNLTMAYSPEGNTRLSGYDTLPQQFLIKGKYTTDLFNIGFGYTNTRDGYIEGGGGNYKTQNPNRPLYGLYGEIYPDANQKYYWEYIDGGAWLAKATIELEPFTLKATYGNDIWYQKTGRPDYLPNSLDCNLDFALSANKTISTGFAFYLGTNHDGLANSTLGLTIGPLTAEVYHDFGGVVFPDMALDGNPYTKLIAKYNLDNTNTLVADFNLDKKAFTTQLYVYFW